MERMNAPKLEDLTELEVDLPLGVLVAELVEPVEPVPQIDPQWPQRGHQRRANSRSPEESRRIEVTRALVQVARVVKPIDVHLLVESQPQLERAAIERIAERPALRVELIDVRDESVRRDRELLVATELLAVLHAAEREGLGHEERSRIAEQRACPGRESEHE